MAGIDTTTTNNTSSHQEDNMACQKKEIQFIKENFGGQTRILSDMGEFTHVVTLQPQNKNITIKFQLTAKYPKDIPRIFVKSSEMSEDEQTELQDHLTSAARERTAKESPLLDIVSEAEEWLTHNAMKLDGTCTNNQKHQHKGKTGKQKRRERREQIEQNETQNEKKPSMKTAEDVINRIMWDEKLPSDDFLVGYIDRFTGLQEKYFNAFSWEDIATVDYTVLAIPKHRIQYFKYKDVMIWDKNKRMDNVFGSLGSNITVYDVMDKYEMEKQKMQEEDSTQDGGKDMEEDEDDSDSDDGITVTTGGNIAVPMCGTGSANLLLSDDEVADDHNDDHDKYWRDKMRPNHFLALRMINPDIQKTVEHIQNVILENEPYLQECCIPPTSLHITLCTLGLDTPEQVAHAVQVLNRIKPELEDIVPKDKPLVLKGLEQFFNRVLYAPVHCPPEFYKFVDHLKLCLNQEGVEIRDNHDFVPHMTLMKVTRPVARATGKKYISPWLYSNQTEVDFGSQGINNVYLCEMGLNRREDGFYMTPTEIQW